MIFRLPLAAAATAWSGAALAADPTPGAGGFLQVLPGLALVLALIGVLAFFAKRAGVTRHMGGGALKLIGERVVGTRERVVIVEVAGQWLVLGVAPGQVRPLAQMARPLDAPAENVAHGEKPPFAAWLERAMGKK